MTAQVIALPRRDGHDPELTYPQLAAHLGVSKRFLQLRFAEGMPSCGFDYAGRRLFRAVRGHGVARCPPAAARAR
jgi:hypothetical protein